MKSNENDGEVVCLESDFIFRWMDLKGCEDIVFSDCRGRKNIKFFI